MSDGASLGTARGQITIDSTQALGSLNQLGGALDNFNSRTQGLTGTTNTFAQSTVGLAQGMQNVGNAVNRFGQAAAEPFIEAGHAAADFQQEMANTNAVMDLSSSQFSDLSDLALQLGKDTIFTGTEAAQGITELGRAGISFQDIMSGAADAATDLAGAAGTSVPQAADVMAAAMAEFDISGQDAVKVADALAGAANFSLTDVNQLGLGLAQVGGVADAANMSMEDTVAFLALMGDNGLKGSDAATSMKSALLRLLSPTDAANDKMQELGIQLFDTQGNFVGLQGASQQFFDAWKRSGQTMEQFLAPLGDVFGSDAIRAILFGMQAIEADQTGIGKGWSDYEAATHDAGAANDFMNKKMDTTEGSIEKLTGSLDVLRTNMGTPLIEGIKAPIDALTEFVNILADIPKPILGAVGIVGALAGGLTALGGTVLVVGGYVLEAVARFQALGIGMDTIVAIGTKVGLALTGIGVAAGIAILALQGNWFGIRDAIQAVIDKITEVIDKFKLFFSLGKAEAGDQGSQGKGFVSGLAQNISALGRAIDAVLGTDISGFFDMLAEGADTLNRFGIGLQNSARLMNIYMTESKRATGAGKAVEAMGMTIDKIFGTHVGPAFQTAAKGIDATINAFQSLTQDSGWHTLPALVESLGIGLETVFGPNGVSDAMENFATVANHVQTAWENASNLGLGPAVIALRTLATAAAGFGFDSLADSFGNAAEKARELGDNFALASQQIDSQGITGLPNAILALNQAMQETLGIGLPDFLIGAANAMAAFQTAMSNGLEQGLNPFQAALKGVGAAIGSVFGTDARNQFFSFVDAMGQLGTAVQGAIQSGLGRVGQMFSEIGTALSQGDISGALTAVQSLISDVATSLQDAGQQAIDWAINVGEPALAGWAAEQAGNFGGWLKEKLQGGLDLAGETLGNVVGWLLEVGIPQLTGWVQQGADLIGPEIQKLVNFAGETLGKVTSWLLEVGVPQLVGWVQNGADLIGPEIQKLLNFAGETLGNIAGWIVEVGAPQLDGWVRDAKGAAAVAIQAFLPTAGEKLGDIQSWILEVGIPTVEAVADFLSGIDSQITAITEDPQLVSMAESAGKDLGTKMGQALGSAINLNLATAINQSMGMTSQAHGADASGLGGNEGAIRERATNIVDAFAETFVTAFKDAIGKEFAKIPGEIGPFLQAQFQEAINEILTTPLLPGDTGQSANNPVSAGIAGADALMSALGLGPDASIGQFLIEEAKKNQAANQEAARQAVTTTVVDPAFAGANEAVGGPFDAVGALKDSALQTILDFANFVTPGAAAAGNEQEAQDAVNNAIVDPFVAASQTVPDQMQSALGDQSGAAQTAIGAGVEQMSIGDALDTAMSQSVSGITLESFSAAIGQLMGEAIVGGLTQASTANIGGSGAGQAAGGIGESIVGALTTSIQTADFSAVGTAISTQIGVALSSGFSQAEAQGPSTAGIDIGTQIALSLASAITGSDFSVVSQAIQSKISQSLSGGQGGTQQSTDTSAAAGEGATIGASIAATLANSILGSDFSVVGQAIQQKISEAVTSATASTGGGGRAGTGPVQGGGGGTGIAQGIVAGIVSSFQGADYSGVGTAIATGVSGAISKGVANINLAAVNAMGEVIKTAMTAAETANEAGTVFDEAIAGTISSGSGQVELAGQAVMTTTVTNANTVAATANTAGTAFDTAVGSGIGAGAGTVTAAATAVITSSIAAASGAAAGASAVGTAFDTAIGGGIGGSAGTVTAAATAVMQAASDAALGAASSAGGAIGAAFDQGIASGIGQNAGVVTAAAAAVVNAAVASAQQTAETGSPSKRTEREIGVPIAEGIIVGMEKKSDDVSKAAGRMVDKVLKHVEQMKSTFTDIANLGARFEGLPGLEDIASGLSSISSHIEDTVGSVRDSLRNIIKSARDELKKGKDQVQQGSDAVAGTVEDSFNQINRDKKQFLRGNLSDVKGSIIDLKSLDEDIHGLRNLSKEMAQGIGPDAQTFSSQISDMADNLQSEQDAAINAAVNMFEQINTALDRAKTKHRKKGRENADEVVGGYTDGITGDTGTAVDATASLADQIINTFNANLKRLPEMADAIGKAIPDSMSNGINSGMSGLTDTVNSMGDAVQTGTEAAAPAIDQSATTTGTDFATAVADAINKQLGTISDAAKGAGTTLDTSFTGAVDSSDAATQSVTSFGQDIINAVNGLMGSIKNSGQAIGQSFTDGVATASPTGTGKSLTDQVKTGIDSGVPAAVNSADNAGSDIGNSLVDSVNAACNPVNSQANSLMTDCIPSGINSGTNDASQAAGAAGQKISDALKNGMEIKKREVENSFKTAGTGFGTNLASGITSKQGDATNAVNNTNKAIGGIDATSQGRSVGVTFGTGIVNGINSTKSNVEDAAASLVRAAKNAADDAADNGSPSRLFMQVGENMMLGVKQGVENIAPDVMSTMGRTAQELAALFAGQGMDTATHNLNTSLGKYTDAIKKSLDEMGRIAKNSPIADIPLPDSNAAKDKANTKAMMTPTVSTGPNVSIGSIQVQKGSPLEKAILDMTEHLQATQGQYTVN